MKTQFQAKYLQHLAKKHGKNKGFTLIELLVVIIIVGVLAAIALPSFLNQIGKARGAEAKSNLGAINRAQQSYRIETGAFSTDIDLLDVTVTNTDNYTYTVVDTGDEVVLIEATADAGPDDLKQYRARADQSADDVFTSITCESKNNKGATADNTVAAIAAADACPGNSVEVK